MRKAEADPARPMMIHRPATPIRHRPARRVGSGAGVTGPGPPTALFAANDYSAIGVLRAAESLGIPVPERLSVLGFDDVPEARTTTPPLTTIRNPSVAMGRQAADLLIAQIAGEPAPPAIHLHPPELVVRESTIAPHRL